LTTARLPRLRHASRPHHHTPLHQLTPSTIGPLLTRRPPSAAAAAALVFLAGTAAALYYSHVGLALSHYDARAHLVVSRRIFDSIVPGWQQIGAVWLPLPHLLDMLPVQIDFFYRTGAFAIAISVASMAATAWALARLMLRTTGSTAGGLTAAALFVANPNLLYLQSTPMTEPLLFATTMLAIMAVAEWVDGDAPAWPHAAGAALTAACMTRYEAWPVTAAIVGLAGLVLLRLGLPLTRTISACARLTLYPAIAIVLFILNSRWTTGHWFVISGFFIAENEAKGLVSLAWEQVKLGTYRLSGAVLIWPAYVSAALALIAFVRSKQTAALVLVLAFVASAALPLYAYYNGHPLRVRYSMPLVFAACALCGVGVGLLPRRVRALAGVALVATILYNGSPLDARAPMVLEAQRDNANRAGRMAVTDYLVKHFDVDGPNVIMASMGSLAHYIHDLSAHGFKVRNFLHEGNGDLWVYAVEQGPHGFAEWILVEEKAEDGDALFHRAQELPQFYRGFERVAEGGGVALYRATPEAHR
jgi:hypothetical protein